MVAAEEDIVLHGQIPLLPYSCRPTDGDKFLYDGVFSVSKLMEIAIHWTS